MGGHWTETCANVKRRKSFGLFLVRLRCELFSWEQIWDFSDLTINGVFAVGLLFVQVIEVFTCLGLPNLASLTVSIFWALILENSLVAVFMTQHAPLEVVTGLGGGDNTVRLILSSRWLDKLYGIVIRGFTCFFLHRNCITVLLEILNSSILRLVVRGQEEKLACELSFPDVMSSFRGRNRGEEVGRELLVCDGWLLFFHRRSKTA